MFSHLIDWIPPSKKNTRDIRYCGEKCPLCGKGKYASTSPNQKAKRNQDALVMLAKAVVAFARGWITEDRLDEIHLTVKRWAKGKRPLNNVTADLLLMEAAGSRIKTMKQAIPEGNHAEVRVVQIIGSEPDEDWVEILVYDIGPDYLPKTRRRGTGRDVVNIPEAILDAFQEVVYTDDKYVSRLVVERQYHLTERQRRNVERRRKEAQGGSR